MSTALSSAVLSISVSANAAGDELESMTASLSVHAPVADNIVAANAAGSSTGTPYQVQLRYRLQNRQRTSIVVEHSTCLVGHLHLFDARGASLPLRRGVPIPETPQERHTIEPDAVYELNVVIDLGALYQVQAGRYQIGLFLGRLAPAHIETAAGKRPPLGARCAWTAPVDEEAKRRRAAHDDAFRAADDVLKKAVERQPAVRPVEKPQPLRVPPVGPLRPVRASDWI